MFCPKCGSPVIENARFCEKCGAGLRAGDTPTSPSSNMMNSKTTGGKSSGSTKLIIGLSVGFGVIIVALAVVLIFVINGSSGESSETVPVAEQQAGGAENTGDARKNPSGGERIATSEAPTATPTPTSEPTPEPTPSPTPEPVVSKYLNNKEFDDLDAIQKYCKKQVLGREIDADGFSIYKMGIRAAGGMTEAYFVSFSWRPSSGKVFIRENGTYHEYLIVSGWIESMTEDGEFFISYGSISGMEGYLGINRYSESDRTYENIDYIDFINEGNAYKTVVRDLCNEAGADKSDLKEVDMELVKSVDLTEELNEMW